MANLQITALIRNHGLMQNVIVLENSSLKREMHSIAIEVTLHCVTNFLQQKQSTNVYKDKVNRNTKLKKILT